MKLKVNIYSFYSEEEWKEKGLNSDILYRGMVYKDENGFFTEINGKRFIVPSKNDLVKKRPGNSVLLNDIEVKKLTRMLEAKSE